MKEWIISLSFEQVKTIVLICETIVSLLALSTIVLSILSLIYDDDEDVLKNRKQHKGDKKTPLLK